MGLHIIVGLLLYENICHSFALEGRGGSLLEFVKLENEYSVVFNYGKFWGYSISEDCIIAAYLF